MGARGGGPKGKGQGSLPWRCGLGRLQLGGEGRAMGTGGGMDSQEGD